jgi:hypothetical protein
MAVHGEVPLKLRHCCNWGCGAPFPICACCDRGQRYCSQACRAQARVRQRRAANRRHQQSAEGQLDHRDRQRRYRCRRHTKRVTDQGSQIVDPPSPSKREEVIRQWAASRFELRPRRPSVFELRCVVCGRPGRLLDPFPRTCTRR